MFKYFSILIHIKPNYLRDTTRAVIKIIKLERSRSSCSLRKKKPIIGMSPKIGTFSSVIARVSLINPPSTAVSPLSKTTVVDNVDVVNRGKFGVPEPVCTSLPFASNAVIGNFAGVVAT